MLSQDARGNVVDLADELEHLIIGQMLEREVSLSHVSRISLAKHGVSVAGNDLARFEGRPQIVGDALVTQITAHASFHLLQPIEYFLIGETVEWSSQTVETSSERKHGGAKSATDQMRRMGADIATLVVGMDGQVQAHKLEEILVGGEAQLVGKVEGVILVLLHWGNLAIFVHISVDLGSDCRKLSNNVH